MYKECCGFLLTTNTSVLYDFFYAYYAKVLNKTEVIIKKMFEERSGNRVEECELRLSLGTDMVTYGLPVVGALVFIINLLQMVALKKQGITKPMVYIYLNHICMFSFSFSFVFITSCLFCSSFFHFYLLKF